MNPLAEISKCAKNPGKYIELYRDLSEQKMKAPEKITQDLIERVKVFVFEQIESSFKSGALSLSAFLEGAILNPPWLESNLESLKEKISILVSEDHASELKKVLSVVRDHFEFSFDPDVVLVGTDGSRIPIWRGFLVSGGEYFSRLFHFNPQNTEVKVDCGKAALEGLTVFFLDGVQSPEFPRDREALEELQTLAQFHLLPGLQKVCQERLLEFEEYLFSYLLLAHETQEHEWVDLIVQRCNKLYTSFSLEHTLPGRIEVTLVKWDDKVATCLEALRNVLEKITFREDIIGVDFFKEVKEPFPQVKTVEFGALFARKFKDLFPHLELGITTSDPCFDPSYWFRLSNKKCPLFMLSKSWFIEFLYSEGTNCIPMTSDELVLQAVMKDPTISCLTLENSAVITDRSIEAAVKFLNLKKVTLKNLSGITDWGLKLLAKRGPGIKALTVRNLQSITDEGLLALSKSGIELTSLSSDFPALSIAPLVGGKLRELTLIGDSSLDNRGLMELLEQCPDLRDLDVSSCPQVTSGFVNLKSPPLKLTFLRTKTLAYKRSESGDIEGYHLKKCRVKFSTLSTLCNQFSGTLELGLTSVTIDEDESEPLSFQLPSLKLFLAEHSHLGNRFLAELISNTPSMESFRMIACKGFKQDTLSLLGGYPGKLGSLLLCEMEDLEDPVVERLLCNATNLKALHLRSLPKLTDKAIESVARFSQLQELDLSLCPHITPDRVLRVIEGKKIHTLGMNNPRDCDLEYLKEYHPKLQTLILSDCENLTEKALKRLPEGLVHLSIRGSSLRHGLVAPYSVPRITLIDCPEVGDADIAHLRPDFKELTVLTILGKTRVTREALDTLQVFRPSLKISYSPT